MLLTQAAAPPDAVDLVGQWRPDLITTAVVLLVTIGYVRNRTGCRALQLAWPIHRDVVFGVGVLATIWTTSGFPQARSDQLMWVWTAQQLLLLLIVPIVVLAAQPVSLMRSVRPGSPIARAFDSPAVKLLGHPLVGPLLVPVLCAVLFFGGLGEVSLTSPEAGWLLHLLLLTVGALIALPLVDRDDNRSSMALGLALGVGMLELILDAVPGAVLRFQTHAVIPFFSVNRPDWAPSWLDDQHTAGNIAWIVAEVIDLPFLLLVATRWIKADAREAARIDAELDAASATTPVGADSATDRPWWLDDPQIRDRYRTGQPRPPDSIGGVS